MGVKIIHISSEVEKEREIRSNESLSMLGYRYIRIINPRYNKYPPIDNVFDGHVDWIVGITKPDPNKFGFTSGHYGACMGHQSAILASFVDDDYTLICECDCLIKTDVDFFRDRVDEAVRLLENSDYKIVRFEAPNWQVKYTEKVSDNIYLGNIMTLGHCYMIHRRHQSFWLEQINKIGWHSPDWWLNYAFERSGELQPSFKDLILTGQAGGISIIDNTFRPDRQTS